MVFKWPVKYLNILKLLMYHWYGNPNVWAMLIVWARWMQCFIVRPQRVKVNKLTNKLIDKWILYIAKRNIIFKTFVGYSYLIRVLSYNTSIFCWCCSLYFWYFLCYVLLSIERMQSQDGILHKKQLFMIHNMCYSCINN
jgi:hypothetical protein